MKACIIYSLFLGLTLSALSNVSGQSYQQDTIPSKTGASEFRFNLRYNSDYLYMGRKDSAIAPYLSPSLTYYHRSGLFLRSSFSLLTKEEESRIDLITLGIGYDYYHKRFTSGIAYTQYFFSDQSYAVQAEMSSFVRLYAAYDFSYFILYADISAGLSEEIDKFLSLELNRSFYAVNNKLSIIPAIYLNAGTQHYYNEYYGQRSVQTGSTYGKGWRRTSPTSTTTLAIIESEKFQILDYETDLQVSYSIKNLKLYTIFTWTFPVNPAIIITDTESYEEKLSNGFYWTAGIRLRF